MKPRLLFSLLTLFLLTLTCAAADPDRLDPDLEVEELRPGLFLQRSWIDVTGFGRVECNGLVYVRDGEALVIDTPGTVHLTETLLDWLEKEKRLKVAGLVVSHTHDDAMAGLEVFLRRGIPSYSSLLTQELAQKQNKLVPSVGFDQRLKLRLGGGEVTCAYLGRGHTYDNIVTYLPEEKVLFGGCLVKAVGAGRGNLADADVEAWAATVDRAAQAFPEAVLVVPGHGRLGGRELLDYTVEMFAPDPSVGELGE